LAATTCTRVGSTWGTQPATPFARPRLTRRSGSRYTRRVSRANPAAAIVRVLAAAVLLAAMILSRGRPDSRDGPGRANRLAGEPSPYLRMHARNPGDWYARGAEWVARARSLD